MRIRGFMKVAMVLALIAVSLFALGGAALASTGLNGPTPPAVGDPVGTNVSPHGGFSATTNYCLQCHSVHSAPGGGARGYALMAETSVTAVCATCHGLFGTGSTGRNRPDQNIAGSPTNIGTTSSRTAYDLVGSATLKAEHTLGETSPPAPDGAIQMYEVGWGYGGFNPARWTDDEVSQAGTADTTRGGLYCGSCHTPHGEYGQAINTKYFRSDAGPGTNEVQLLYIDHAQSGFQFYLSYGGVATATLTYGPALQLAAIQSALEAIPALAGNVTVANNGTSATCSATGCSNVKITFGGGLALTDVEELVATDVTPTTGAAHVATLMGGGAAGSMEAVYEWKQNALIYRTATIYFLNKTAAGIWQACAGPNGGVPCSDLTTADSEGQTKYLYGYNLLTTYPNHQWNNPESWGVAYRGRDAARWCGQCHPSKVSSEFGTAFTAHNHPSDCTYCHGNAGTDSRIPAPAGAGVSRDYPHTSDVGDFLKAYPDGLCVGCHTSGSLV